MRPELFSIFGIHFFAYRTMLAIAFVVGTLLSARLANRSEEGLDLTPLAGIWALVGALIGARAFYVMQYENLSRLPHALFVWEGGLVFYGGLAGGMVAVLVHLRWRRTPVGRAFDAMAAPLALGEAITRVGCFLNGCCYGRACAWPWAVRFPPGSIAYAAQLDAGIITSEAPLTTALHPTELYMTGGLIVAFIVLWWFHARRPRAWAVFFAYLVLYGLVRFGVEAFRGDSARSVAGLTVSQAISLVLFIVGIIALVVRTRRAPAARD